MSQEAPEQGGAYKNRIREGLAKWPDGQARQDQFTASSVAERCGVTRPAFSEIVNGHKLPTDDQLTIICEVLGWKDDQLYREEFLVAIRATRRPAEAA